MTLYVYKIMLFNDGNCRKKTKTKKIKLKINHLILFYKLIERATNYKENILMSLKKCDFFYKNVENDIRLCK